MARRTGSFGKEHVYISQEVSEGETLREIRVIQYGSGQPKVYVQRRFVGKDDTVGYEHATVKLSLQLLESIVGAEALAVARKNSPIVSKLAAATEVWESDGNGKAAAPKSSTPAAVMSAEVAEMRQQVATLTSAVAALLEAQSGKGKKNKRQVAATE